MTKRELQALYIYCDQSGDAYNQLKHNLDIIDEREAVLKDLRRFIKIHAATLAGLYWRVEYLDREVKVKPFHYRGQQTTPADVAKLWPDAKWKREKPRFWRSENDMTRPVRDWAATIDGILVRLEEAETLKPVKFPNDGAVVLQ